MPAASTLWAPTVTPSTTVTCAPIHTSSSTTTPAEVSPCQAIGTSRSSNTWFSPTSTTYAAILTTSPIVTRPIVEAPALSEQFSPMATSPRITQPPAMVECAPTRSRSATTCASGAITHLGCRS